MEDNRLEIINAAVEKDSAFADKLAKCSSAEELQKVLSEIGVELNADEAKTALEQSKRVDSDELSAEDMDNVAGGSVSMVIAALVAIMSFNPKPIPTLPRKRW